MNKQPVGRIGNISRIKNPTAEFFRKQKIELDFLVENQIHKNILSARRNYRRPKPATCSQCGLAMEANIAKIQIENKRENAPICTACCMGIKRKGGKYVQ